MGMHQPACGLACSAAPVDGSLLHSCLLGAVPMCVCVCTGAYMRLLLDSRRGDELYVFGTSCPLDCRTLLCGPSGFLPALGLAMLACSALLR